MTTAPSRVQCPSCGAWLPIGEHCPRCYPEAPMDDLSRLLELPALARLSATGDELALITLTHDHADRVVVERRRLGGSIDLHELLSLVGLHGIAEAPRVEVSTVQLPELPAPVEAAPVHALLPTARRTTRRQPPPAGLPCPDCERTFKNAHARVVHQGRAHKAAPAAPEPDPEPAPAASEPTPIGSGLGCFVCPHCGKQFKSRLGYTTHIDIAHATEAPPDAASAPLREYGCSKCGAPLTAHLRCSDCQALLGPGHDAGETHMIVNGKPLCRVCVSYRGAAKNLMRMP